MPMLATCHSACVRGVDGEPTEVQVHLRRGNPKFDVVGLPDAAGREARDRVRSAIVTSGYEFPTGHVVVNLAPATTPKSGAAHDLPIALAILAVAGVLDREALDRTLCFGELALDGRIRPVSGAFLLTTTAAPRNLEPVICSPGNAAEAALACDVPVHAPMDLVGAVRFLAGQENLPPVIPAEPAPPCLAGRDFAEVRGQEAVKRAVLVAAAGGHNLLLVGPPGAGKTLLAERFPDLLPPLGRAHALEVARMRSAAGVVVDGLPRRRPFRSPSCNASAPGVLGGGSPPRPGEISLAHRGVLFLDEIPHFRPDVLEGLRQPLESGTVSISRAQARVTFPARFQLIAAMNPCPCGYAGTPRCNCTPMACDRYRRRLSGPLLDRFDLRVHVPPVSYADLSRGPAGLSTADLAGLVARARTAQLERFGDVTRLNMSIRPGELRRWCKLGRGASSLLERACDSGRLSARGVARVRRVARTIADLSGEDGLTQSHVLQALRWRVEPTG